jgi:hypothetical protein
VVDPFLKCTQSFVQIVARRRQTVLALHTSQTGTSGLKIRRKNAKEKGVDVLCTVKYARTVVLVSCEDISTVTCPVAVHPPHSNCSGQLLVDKQPSLPTRPTHFFARTTITQTCLLLLGCFLIVDTDLLLYFQP